MTLTDAQDQRPEQATEPTDGPLTVEELRLSSRNHAMPLEALRLDRTPVGMHYLLVHFDIPILDASTWRMRVGGAVRKPLDLGLDDLRTRPAETHTVTMECAGNGRAGMAPRPMSQPWLDGGVGTADWTGTPLAPLLLEAGLDDDVAEIVFTGADRGEQGGDDHAYARSLSVPEAMSAGVLLAYEMNGQPLAPQHGFPLRLLVPGWYGMTSVKWLTSIEATTEPFEGFQQARAYRYQQNADDPGRPVTRIAVRSLMVPPGVPEFFSRSRIVKPGATRLEGRAWSGHGDITRLEVLLDDTWVEAELGLRLGPYAWRHWSLEWDAVPGEHELACRATDATGAVQPLEPPWNYQGMSNNAVQRVRVTVPEG